MTKEGVEFVLKEIDKEISVCNAEAKFCGKRNMSLDEIMYLKIAASLEKCHQLVRRSLQ